jgi:hypothetical protein
MVVDPVLREPVSGPFFPLTGKNTGKNRKEWLSRSYYSQKVLQFRAFCPFLLDAHNREGKIAITGKTG